ncbi:MAG: helix-turn-helix domain-containing protein, partial [Acidimicrobiales bacterium]
PEFGPRHRLLLALEAAGLSIQDLAGSMGLSRNTIGNWLAGRTHPKDYALREIAGITGVDPQWLLTGTPSTQPDPTPALRVVQGDECAPWDSNPEPAVIRFLVTNRTIPQERAA